MKLSGCRSGLEGPHCMLKGWLSPFCDKAKPPASVGKHMGCHHWEIVTREESRRWRVFLEHLPVPSPLRTLPSDPGSHAGRQALSLTLHMRGGSLEGSQVALLASDSCVLMVILCGPWTALSDTATSSRLSLHLGCPSPESALPRKTGNLLGETGFHTQGSTLQRPPSHTGTKQGGLANIWRKPRSVNEAEEQK